MDDKRKTEQYRRSLLTVESDYQTDVLTIMDKARLLLVDTLSSRVLKSFNLIKSVRGAVADLKSGVDGLSERYFSRIGDVSSSYARNQFDIISDYYDVSFSQALDDTDDEVEEQEDNFFGASTLWIDALETSMIAEIIHLQSEDEDTEAVIARLVAADIEDGRASVWRNGENSMKLASSRNIWIASGAILLALYLAGQKQSGQTWYKQAVATLDWKTTNCCKYVHGQLQPLEKPFTLVGTPRFRDKMQQPPFHLNCRTATAAWIEPFSQLGIGTGEVWSAARSELGVQNIERYRGVKPKKKRK